MSEPTTIGSNTAAALDSSLVNETHLEGLAELILNWLPVPGLWVLPLIPLLAAVLIPCVGRWPQVREAVSLLAGLLLALAAVPLLAALVNQQSVATESLTWLPGLDLRLEAEPLGGIFTAVAAFLWPIATLYSIGYMRGNNEPRQTVFYVCFAVALASTMGIALSGNLVTLFIFYELLTFSTYPLVTHKGDAASLRAGRVYLGLLVGGSLGLLLPAIVWSHLLAGHSNFVAGGLLPNDLSAGVTGLLLGMYAFGIGKAALMPIHAWLPAAMVAPTPVSALLHAVAVVKAGVFCLLKVMIYVFGLDLLQEHASTDWLLYVACVTTVTASAIALAQDNLKRRLAFSTIGQLAYVSIAAALFTPASMLGGGLHIAGHAFGKITLFFAAGAIYTAAHKTLISQLKGIGRQMPITMTAFTIGSLSMIGLPPTAGFVSKWHIVQAAGSAGAWFALVAMVLSTLLTAGYFLPIVQTAFARPDDPADLEKHGEAPWPICLAMILTSALVLGMFVLPGPVLALARQLVELAQ